jgi:hypothetical protein
MTDEKPSEGGSYELQKDGALKRVEHTAPAPGKAAAPAAPRRRAQKVQE